MNFSFNECPSPQTPKAIRSSSPELAARATASDGRRVPGSGFAVPGLTAGLIFLLATSAGAEPLPDPLAAGWKGEKVCEVMQETDKHRMLQCAFPPGVGHERHFHAPHVGLILKGGTMRITDDKGVREQETPAGATWESDGIAWHEALNIGVTTAVYFIVEDKTP